MQLVQLVPVLVPVLVLVLMLLLVPVLVLVQGRVRSTFMRYDRDGSGDLDRREIGGALKELGVRS